VREPKGGGYPSEHDFMKKKIFFWINAIGLLVATIIGAIR